MKEQLRVLVANVTFFREIAIDNDNLPTAKVERVEKFGGCNYASDDFFHLYSGWNMFPDTLLLLNCS